MNKKTIVLTVLLSIAAVSAVVFLTSKKNKEGKVCFRNKCFKVEIADTPMKRRRGLQGRSHLPLDEGMLFVFEEAGKYSFWMKKTLIPLDIIWIDSDFVVVDIKNNTQPCKSDFCPTFTSSQKAKYVLEINAFLAEENGIKVGDKASFYFSP